ncbi:hypothetical protein EDB85DRAFT_2147884 [Lactarius pseudohatsudake]|nr:hypothetical protein EDB85DRAFT_2147884 [Lactarius pseudohatsudake]
MKGDDVDGYIATFERFAHVADWHRDASGTVEFFRRGLSESIHRACLQRTDIPETMNDWQAAARAETQRARTIASSFGIRSGRASLKTDSFVHTQSTTPPPSQSITDGIVPMDIDTITTTQLPFPPSHDRRPNESDAERNDDASVAVKKDIHRSLHTAATVLPAASTDQYRRYLTRNPPHLLPHSPSQSPPPPSRSTPETRLIRASERHLQPPPDERVRCPKNIPIASQRSPATIDIISHNQTHHQTDPTSRLTRITRHLSGWFTNRSSSSSLRLVSPPVPATRNRVPDRPSDNPYPTDLNHTYEYEADYDDDFT